MNNSVFNRFLKADNDGEDVTDAERLFQTRAAATGNARSPMVECAVLGTINAAVDADRSRFRESLTATLCSSVVK